MKYTLKSGLIATDFEVDNIRDYPDFCDAYISEANVYENGEWRDATEDELDELNEDDDFVYSCIQNLIY